MPNWSVAEISDLSGKTFVITGATHGLGEAMAMALSARNATLVLGCRDAKAGEAVAERAGGNARSAALDLADLRSVHSFANQVDAADVLINNAAVMATPHRFTTDGFETQFGTNHLGHFALTGLLLPKVTERIVTVSSFAHMWGRIELDDLNFEHRKYNRWAAYGQAKLANLMFALELARRLRQAGSPVSAMSAHPGYAVTNLIYHSENRILESIMRQGELMGQSAAQGARPPLRGDLPCGGQRPIFRPTPIPVRGTTPSALSAESNRHRNSHSALGHLGATYRSQDRPHTSGRSLLTPIIVPCAVPSEHGENVTVAVRLEHRKDVGAAPELCLTIDAAVRTASLSKKRDPDRGEGSAPEFGGETPPGRRSALWCNEIPTAMSRLIASSAV